MHRRAQSGLLGRTEGATVIEYAIVVPILMLLLMGIVEYNTIMYAMSILDGAITAASREGSTGYVNSTNTGTCPSPLVGGVISPQSQATYLNCLIQSHVSGLLFNTSKLQVTYNDTGSTTFSSTTDSPTFPTGPCTNNPALVNLPTFPLCAENTQTAGDIVVYTVTYPWPVYTPVLKTFLGTGGVFTLQASAVVKNEPYNVGAR